MKLFNRDILAELEPFYGRKEAILIWFTVHSSRYDLFYTEKSRDWEFEIVKE